MILLPAKEGETAESIGGYLAPLQEALIDHNSGHVIVVVCKSDYHALKRGIKNLPAPPRRSIPSHAVGAGAATRRGSGSSPKKRSAPSS